MIFKKKRTKNDAPAPIVKPISVDVQAIWNRKKTVSQDLQGKVFESLQKNKREQ